MNFKEIRLVGFKSFADKTNIKFDDGVTCIVGPNGCGKSNVADAVRWVLGEQSAKTLRGSSMQDVIFGGTEARRALSYCEVTLVFDNHNKLFDIEYEEVAMTRRLYRSGESEYLLNMQPCRLKDIVTLLHGVGIGKEGYSIIGQGKVEQIMNAKPEDRRAIFEEATGVMRFKTEKGEIERKLENSKDNLTIFSQRMDEIERQLAPLEQQAEKAKKYRTYRDDLKYEEVNIYLSKSDAFEGEKEKHEEKIRAARAELETVNARSGLVEQDEQKGREKIAEADRELREINDKLRAFEVGIEHKSGEAKVIGERIKSYSARLKTASDDVDYYLRRSEEIGQNIAEGEKKKAKGEQRVAAITGECEQLYKSLQAAEARLAEHERLSGEKHASEISSVESLADLRVNVGSLSAKRDAASERMEEVRAAIAKSEGRKDQYAKQLQDIRKERAEVEAFLDSKDKQELELSSHAADLNDTVRRITQEIVDCNTTVANLKNNLEIYTNIKNRFDGYRDSVRRLQQEAKRDPELGRRIKGTIADIVSTERKYEVAIETAFGGAMQYLITATRDDARYLIEYLKRTGGGVATFLPVDGVRTYGDSRELTLALSENGAVGKAADLIKYDPYFESIIRNLLGNTLVCETIAGATQISKKYRNAFKIVTLDGDIISTSGSMTGGSRKKESGNLLAGERMIKECEEGIARKKALEVKLRSALENCERELGEVRNAQEAFRNRVQEETAHFAAVCQRENATSSLIEDCEHDIADYNALLERIGRAVELLQSEVISSSENEDLLNKIREEAAAETTERAKQGEKLKADRDAIADKLHALQVEAAGVKSSIASEAENNRRLAEEREGLMKKVEDSRVVIRTAEQTINDLKRQEEKVALTEEEQHVLAALRGRLDEIDAEKRETSERQNALAEEKRALIARQFSLNEKIHESELEISRAQTTLESMREHMQEEYELDYEGADALRDPAFDPSKAQANINSLRHKMAALGSINQNAEEDFEQLNARYQEMTTQRQDIEKGISDLTTALNQLKETMQKQFDTGFNQINENFTRIFKELFGGGKAEMQLDYSECTDPLDAGVEIIACPPGKKLTKISLLSGGERAFTAIAILFAILKTCPMPFCILDEIEAALDEANVDRFAKYLKKFSAQTQFIVITHRKPTMNQADSLFGVTMEEKGVSKIVSVKLSEVESRLGGDTVI